MEHVKSTQTPGKAESSMVECEMPPRCVRVVIVVGLTVVLLAVPLLMVVSLSRCGLLAEMAKEHAPAMLGVPWAGGAAFIVVLVLRTSFGPVEFEVLGTKFKGALGPIVMWVFCFLVEIAAIRVLW